ncbi:MAG: hypothetical protein KDA96_27660, partial [Planctomycetaceae bacterium]|nr:hypothetical protein [Planctomycetaceae bacterium]
MSETITDTSATSRKRRAIPWLSLTVVMCLAAVAAYYWWETRIPRTLRIAGGPEGGRYLQIAQGLARELRSRHGVLAEVVPTEGSLQNLELLAQGRVDVCLYQPETHVILRQASGQAETIAGDESVRFISNLYTEAMIPIVSADDDGHLLQHEGSLRIGANAKRSGDMAMAILLRRHLGREQDESSVLTVVPYSQVRETLKSDDVDIVVITAGLQAPVIRETLLSRECRLADVPLLEAMLARNPSLRPVTIPAGYFHTAPGPIPALEFHTVGLPAQLLTATDVPTRLVEMLTEVAMDPQFQRGQNLSELFSQGAEFADGESEFPQHPGAEHVFRPELKPLLNPDFVEGTEGIRSFVVSMLAAIWLCSRWWRRRRILGEEHRLDRFIRRLLEIERRQLDIDGQNSGDEQCLQQFL